MEVKEDENVVRFVTKLVDAWNVGIKTGYVHGSTLNEDKVKKYLRSVGITLYLDYEWQTRSTKFIMVKTSEADTVANPLE